jgi:hypothetical protein
MSLSFISSFPRTLRNAYGSVTFSIFPFVSTFFLLLLFLLSFFVSFYAINNEQELILHSFTYLGESIEAKTHENVSMLFSDIVGFTSICSTATPMQVVTMLQSLYTQFDAFCGQLDVYKVSIIMEGTSRNGSTLYSLEAFQK